MTNTIIPEPREYLELTLHMQGGGKVVAAVLEYKSLRSKTGDGYTSLKWTNTGWGDLPKLESVDLPRLTAITSRQIVEDQ